MGQPVIVVPGASPEPAGDASAAFAAGVAAATATQAEETAQAAAAVAGEAVEAASEADQAANRAIDEAFNAQAETLALARRLERLEDIVDDVSEALTMDDGPDEDPTLPPKVTVTVEPETESDKDKPADPPRKRGFGSKAWFGNRE